MRGFVVGYENFESAWRVCDFCESGHERPIKICRNRQVQVGIDLLWKLDKVYKTIVRPGALHRSEIDCLKVDMRVKGIDWEFTARFVPTQHSMGNCQKDDNDVTAI